MVEGSDELERLSREQLILKARVLGVERPELMTRVEMRDEIVRRSEPDLVQQKRARGFLGVARDLVASVVEAGLNLPDAAAIIRGEGSREHDWRGPPPVATVTLAEIYAAQGHLERALRMLDEVLAKEPDHDPARALRDRLAAGADLPRPAPRKQRISFADPPESDSLPVNVNVNVNVNVPVPVPNLPAEPPDLDLPAEPPLPAGPAVSAEPEPRAESAAPYPSDPVNVNVPAPDLSENENENDLLPSPAQPALPPPAQPALPLRLSPSSPHVLTLSLSNQRQIYWEVPPQALSALAARFPHGRPVVRVLSFRTRAGKVERRAQDLSVSISTSGSSDSEVGSAVLPGLTADAVVRAALGWETDGRFVPFVVASDMAAQSFRAHPLVGAVDAGLEARAVRHLSRRSPR